MNKLKSWKACSIKFGVKKHLSACPTTCKTENPLIDSKFENLLLYFKKIESYLDFRNRELTFFRWKERKLFFLDTGREAFDVFRSIRFRSIGFKSIRFKSIGFKSTGFYPCSWTSWKAVLSNLGSRNTFSMEMEPFSLFNYMENRKPLDRFKAWKSFSLFQENRILSQLKE